MKGGLNLQKIRVGISIPIFLLFVLSFLGEERILEIFSHTFLYFQIVPSLIRFFFDPINILSLGCIVILVVTLFFGRVYCSFLCPLGMLQDLLFWLSKKTGLKRKRGHRKPYQKLQLVVLLYTFLAAVLGSYFLLNLLDPYSFFGRISAHLSKGVLIMINNCIVTLLEIFDIYDLSIKRQHHIPLDILLITIVSFGCLFFAAIFTGRLYCNSICPVGTFLGLVSRFSFVKIGIDRPSCASCNLCEKVCKAGCIKSSKKEIDHSRCLICFDCLTVCQTKAIGYRFKLLECNNGSPVSLKRRSFLGAVAAVGCTWATEPLLLASNKVSDLKKSSPITPPGSSSINHFTSRCSGCHLCVSACPTHTLVPSLWRYGVLGLLQPEMNYHLGHCEISCTVCSSICPTGAILPITKDEKKQIQIGVVTLNKQLCVVHVKKIHCGACGEACPTNAIFPIEKGLVVFPEINNKYCIGCGGCERACPTKPKSIVVTANTTHRRAEIYVPPQLPLPGMDEKGDFPF